MEQVLKHGTRRAVTEAELVKKKRRPKGISKKDGRSESNTFPTLAHIVLSNGLRVDIPKLPSNISELTSYDNLRIALEHAALATQWLVHLSSTPTPRLADCHNMAPIRLNLEDLMNHLYYAIQDFPKGAESL